jgi:hypothetical protein
MELAAIENASMNDRVMYLSISCGECLIEIVIFSVDLFRRDTDEAAQVSED